MTDQQLKKGDTVYYARIFPSVNIYEVYELKLRTVTDDYCVGIEKHSRQSFLFPNSAIGKTVFQERGVALDMVKAAELNDPNFEE